MARRPTRRTVLRGLLGGAVVSVGLPPLEAFMNASGTAYAGESGFPKRFGLFFWGNGNLPHRWTPAAEGADWPVSEELVGLEGLQHLVTVVSGMAVKLENTNPHGSGAAGFLSGMTPMSLDDSGFRGPSIDQIIAAEIGGETIYRSLETAVTPNEGLSYNGENNRNPPESSPFAFYERVFGASFREPGEGGLVDPTLGLRRSVLDAVLDDIHSVQGQVGAADRERLEQHFDGVRELEQRLARLEEDPPDLAACYRPDEPAADYPDLEGRPQIVEINGVMSGLIAMALACDQTRVFSHFLSKPVNDVLFTGTSAGHHDLTHNEPGDQDEVNAITIQCVEAYAQLVRALDAIPEGEGTLLDSCAVLGTSEVSEGKLHSISDMPILIAGSACGALRQGIHHASYTDENASKVMLSILRALDINAASYGEDLAQATDGLSGIET